MAHTLIFRQFVRALQLARHKNLLAAGKPLPIPQQQIGWSRRKFIKSSLLTSAILSSISSITSQARTSRARKQPEVAIIGAGIAGLNAAYQLKKLGIEAKIYEAQSRVGGRLMTVTQGVGNGLITDLGGELINSDHFEVLQLVDEFKLELFNRSENAEPLPYPKVGYFFNDQVLDETQVAEDLQPLAEQIANDSARLDEDFEHYVSELDALSVKDYLDRHAKLISKTYIRKLVEATIRTEYGVEPGDSSALQLIYNLPMVNGQAVEVLGNSDEIYVFKGGSSQLIKQLQSVLEEQIETRMPLVSIDKEKGRFKLKFSTGSLVYADYVILTLPFPVLRRIKLNVPIPKKLRKFIKVYGLGRNEKLIAGFDQRAWRQANGFVSEAWTDRGFAEVWDATQRQPERKQGALTFFLGGQEIDNLYSAPTKTTGRSFVRNLDEIIPGIEDASRDRFIRTRWQQARYSKGAYSNLKPGQYTEYSEFFWTDSPNVDERQMVHAGKLIFAGEHLSDAYYGFINGAAETGRLAAEFVFRQVN